MRRRVLVYFAVALAEGGVSGYITTTTRHPIHFENRSPLAQHLPPKDDRRILGYSPSQLAGTRSSDAEEADSGPSLASISMVGLPFLSVVFPVLLQTARSLPPNSSEQLLVVTALFVGNRAYLYAMAATIVALAALRGANDTPALGKRITDLTEELLYRPDLTETLSDPVNVNQPTTAEQPVKETLKIIQSMRQSGVEESFDQVSSETQALILPLLVSFLLAASIFFLPFWNTDTTGSTAGTADNLKTLLADYLPVITQIWNVGILGVFCKSEIRRLALELSLFPTSAWLEWGLAAGITGVACFTPLWPAQNFVNMALAVLVARLIQLDKFSAIVAALGLLTLYDVTSVFLIPAAGAAVESSDMLVSAAGDSAMGSVAIQKLTSGTFQPGLLVTKIDRDYLGGALGLGDAVFPSLLATFLRRFDLEQPDGRLSLFAVSLGGYLLGCTACEFAPILSTTGLPALVFIIPFMLGSVLAAATVSGELEALWNYDPKATNS